MPQTRVIVGEFARPAFREGLLARLSAQHDLAVASMAAVDLGAALADASSPLVLLLDGARPGIDLSALPSRDALVVIQIGEEGRFADIRLQKLDIERIVSAIRGYIHRSAGAFHRLAGAPLAAWMRRLRAAGPAGLLTASMAWPLPPGLAR